MGNVNEGVYLSNAAGNTIGGDVDGAGNVIAYNGAQNVDASGVRIQDADALGNSIWRNSIYSNAALGIQLDAGGNNDQDAPSLTSADNGSTTIGTLDSTPNTTYRLEFFANPACDPSGSAKARRSWDSPDVTTNGAGHRRHRCHAARHSGARRTGHSDRDGPRGNTSEFSACVEVTGSRHAHAVAIAVPIALLNPRQQRHLLARRRLQRRRVRRLGPRQRRHRRRSQRLTPDAIQGDVTCDEEANSVDSLVILREVAGLGEGACAENGDMNCDGDRTSVDALGVLRYVAGLAANQNEPCADIGTEV